MTNAFPAFIFIWILVHLLKGSDQEKKSTTPIHVEEKIEPEKYIQYFSNGRLLNSFHLSYYLDLLSLTTEKQITDHTILIAAEKRYGLINKINLDEKWPISSRDVNAAKQYLMDRWLYVTNLN